MLFKKKITTAIIDTAFYDVDRKVLRIVLKDGVAVDWAGVPINIFHGLPTGQSCESYLMKHVHNQYVKTYPDTAAPASDHGL